MGERNTSDSIEKYIKQILAQYGFAEIQRSSLADTFQVVPSQINYVIKTRFSESKGYVVESKRGGGGYIRIAKRSFSDHHQFLCYLEQSIGESVSLAFFEDVLALLCGEQLLTQKERVLLLSLSGDDVLGDEGMLLRGRILRKLIHCLDRKDKE